MNRIAAAFKNPKSKKVFIAFVTGGDPTLEKTEEYILALIEGGAGLIEIGVPFSDPIAEGPVIQEANIRALKSGTTLAKLFDLVKKLRTKTDVPFVFLTYLNPVFRMGYGAFFAKCKAVGVDGVIIPDLPFEERGEAIKDADANDIAIITLVAPTSHERIARIAKDARGFVYVVSSMGVTGIRGTIDTDLSSIIAHVRKATTTPVAVGFGINTSAQARDIGALADGVIVGSAIVKLIATHGENAADSLRSYAKEMQKALE